MNQHQLKEENSMIKLRLVKIMTIISCVLSCYFLVLYFAVVGVIGVFVISQEIMLKISENYVEMNDTLFLAINISIAFFFGMVPFGLVAAKCFPVWFKKWIVN